MKKFLFPFIALLLLARPVFGLPPEKLLEIPVMHVGSVACVSGAAIAFENPEAQLRVVYHPKTELIVILDFKEDKAFLGKVELDGDRLRYIPKGEMKVEEIQKKYPHVCLYLEQRES